MNRNGITSDRGHHYKTQIGGPTLKNISIGHDYTGIEKSTQIGGSVIEPTHFTTWSLKISNKEDAPDTILSTNLKRSIKNLAFEANRNHSD